MASALGLTVVTTRRGSVFVESSPDSGVLKKFETGERLEALAKGPKGWIQVEVDGEKGWIQRAFVKTDASARGGRSGRKAPGPLDGINSQDSELSATDDSDPELSEDPLISRFDRTLDKTVAAKKGRLFEQPSKYSERFGIVEAGDEFHIIKKNKGWVNVRLKLTGEEGWYPAANIKVARQKRLGRSGNNGLEAELGIATKGYRYSLGLGYFYNFNGGDPTERNRLEAGLVGSYYVGERLTDGTAQLVSTYTTFLGLGRYSATGVDGYFAGGGELGIGYLKASIANAGISKDVVKSKGLDQNPSGFRLAGGVFGGWNFTEHITGALGFRLILLGEFVVNSYLGLKVRF